MNDDRLEELAALHALDLLEGAERAEFEAALARDPRLRQRVRELQEASAALAHLAPSVEPPAELKQRILASAGAKTAAPSNVISFPSLLPWAAAACFALAAAWCGHLCLDARSEAAVLRDQQKLADLELQTARTQLEEEHIIDERQMADSRQLLAARQRLEDAAKLNEQALADSNRQIADLTGKLRTQGDLAELKISTLASMLGNSPQALAVAVWNPQTQEGVLTVSKLPAATNDKDYQLWVIPEGAAPVSAGIVSVENATGETRMNFKAVTPVKSIAKFAVSLERKGGSSTTTPQGSIVLISQ